MGAPPPVTVEALYLARRDRWRRLARRFGVAPDDVEDVVQELMLFLLERPGLAAWLNRHERADGRHGLLHAFRRVNGHKTARPGMHVGDLEASEVHLVADQATPEEETLAREAARELERQLAELRPLQRAALLASLEGVDRSEAAASLGMTSKSMGLHLMKARDELTQKLGRQRRRQKPRRDPRERVREVLADGAWHTEPQLRSAAGIHEYSLAPYLAGLAVERRKVNVTWLYRLAAAA